MSFNGKFVINKEDFKKALRLRYELYGLEWRERNLTPAKLIELGLDWLIKEIE